MQDSAKGEAMIKLSEGTVVVVAEDTRTAVRDFDSAYVASLRLAANAIEGIGTAGVPVVQSQRLIRTFNDGFGKLSEGRSSIVSAIAQLQIIHKHSNQAEVDVGCGAPWRVFTSGQLDADSNDLASAGLEGRS